jgi:signal transduction histidine kinase
VGVTLPARLRSVAWSKSAVPDVVLVVAVAAVDVVGTAVLTAGKDMDLPAYAMLAANPVPLLVRRGRPRAATAGVMALSAAYDLAGYPGGFYTLPIAICLYTLADLGLRWLAAAALAAVVGTFLVVGVGLGRGHVSDLTNALWFAGWLCVSLVLGEVARSRRAYVEQVQQRALEAERSREEEARRRVSEERVRIARELHDILAHRISSISVQAGMGAQLLDKDPEQARRALAAIGEVSREALAEVRTTLGMLRQVDEPAPRAPSPGLAQLDGVIADTAASGVEVSVAVEGIPRELPGGVDLAAYRIVEEALTNVVRHARAAHARVAISYRPADVQIEVTDDGRGASDVRDGDGSGNGMMGMRERARSLGGDLEAGPRAPGGFFVRACLPTGSGS